MPVGPVGVLLMRSGLVDGLRVAVAAACGIATVDLLYGVVAVAVGAPVSRARRGARGRDPDRLRGGARRGRGRTGCSRRPPARPRPPDAASTHGTYLRFVGLTAVNPLTAVTFTTVAIGMAAGLGGSSAAAVAFVAGVGLASLAWQLVLALTSGLLGLRLPAGRAALGLDRRVGGRHPGGRHGRVAEGPQVDRGPPVGARAAAPGRVPWADDRRPRRPTTLGA